MMRRKPMLASLAAWSTRPPLIETKAIANSKPTIAYPTNKFVSNSATAIMLSLHAVDGNQCAADLRRLTGRKMDQDAGDLRWIHPLREIGSGHGRPVRRRVHGSRQHGIRGYASIAVLACDGANQ